MRCRRANAKSADDPEVENRAQSASNRPKELRARRLLEMAWRDADSNSFRRQLVFHWSSSLCFNAEPPSRGIATPSAEGALS
jgi:hypothetical protein